MIDILRKKWVELILLPLLMGSGSFLLNRIQIDSTHFESVGMVVISSLILKLIITLLVFLSTLSLGYYLFFRYSKYLGVTIQLEISSLDMLILAFSTGSSILALIAVALGFAGLLNQYSISVVCFASSLCGWPHLVNGLKNCFKLGKYLIVTSSRLSLWIGSALSGLIFINLFFFLSGGGLLPIIDPDGDIYHTYYPYYRHILESQNLYPHQYGFQYYDTKGMGIGLILNCLTDFTGVQLASIMYSIMSVVCLLSLVARLSKSYILGLASTLLSVSIMTATEYNSAYFAKNHAITSSIIIFAFALTVGAIYKDYSIKSRKIFGFGLTVLLGYLGFAFPIPSFIPLVGIFIVYLISFFQRELFKPLCFGYLSLLSGFLINYLLTGAPQIVPLNITWMISNREKYVGLMGVGGIANTIYSKHLEPGYAPFASFEWVSQCLRIYFFELYFGKWISYFFIVSIFILVIKKPYRNYGLVYLSFLISSVLFILIGGRDRSIVRFETYNVWLNSVHVFLGICAICHFKNHKKNLAIGLIILLFSGYFSITQMPVKFAKVVLTFLGGQTSYSSALTRNLDAQSQRIFDNWTTIKKYFGYQTPIVWLTPLPRGIPQGLSFPGSGAVLHPTIEFGSGSALLEMVFGEPEKAKEFLKRKGWNLFQIVFDGPFNNPLAYSQLFAPESFRNFFCLVYQAGEVSIFSWSDSGKCIKSVSLELMKKYALALKPKVRTPDHYRDLYQSKDYFLSIIGMTESEIIQSNRWNSNW